MDSLWWRDLQGVSDFSSDSSGDEADRPEGWGIFIEEWTVWTCFAVLSMVILWRILDIGDCLRCRCCCPGSNGSAPMQSSLARLIIHLLLLPPMLTRAIDMALNHYHYMEADFTKQTTLQFLTGSLPGYLFFCAYSLLFLWLQFSFALFKRQLSSDRKQLAANNQPHAIDRRATLWVTYLVTVAIVWGVWLLLAIGFALSPMKSSARWWFHFIEACWASFTAFIMGTAFLFVLPYTKVILRQQLTLEGIRSFRASRSVTKMILKVRLLTFVFTLCLWARSVVILLNFCLHGNGQPWRIGARAFEIIPTAMALWILWNPLKVERIPLLSSISYSKL